MTYKLRSPSGRPLVEGSRLSGLMTPVCLSCSQMPQLVSFLHFKPRRGQTTSVANLCCMPIMRRLAHDCRADRLLTAKRAYLHTLAFPPAIFSSPTSPHTALVKPYDGPDAQAVIQNVNSRQHNNNSRGHNVRGSVSHGRGVSVSHSLRTNIGQSNGTANGSSSDTSPRDREQPSPTLPTLPTHPTLNSLISSTLGEAVADPTASDPAVIAAQPEHGGPRIGDPGKRMIGTALGMRHPGLPPRVLNGGANGVADVQRAMGGLVVSE